jgi:hypothetical protein
MLREFFSSLRNRSPYKLESSKVERVRDEKSDLFHYIQHDHFIHKKYEKRGLLRSYYTCDVESHVSFEDAKSKSISFDSSFRKIDFLRDVKGGSLTHYNLGIRNYVLTEMWIKKFSDGSFITEIRNKTVSTKSLILDPPNVVKLPRKI